MRINVVKSARKAQSNCFKCDKPINVGDPYKWFKHRHGGKNIRCADCPTWRASELTTSNQLSIIYGATETAEEEIGAWDGEDLDAAKDILTTCAESVREAAEEYRSSAEAIESGFGHSTYVSDELTEKADNVEGWADEMDQALDGVDEWDEDTQREEARTQIDDEHNEEENYEPSDDEVNDKLNEMREEWADNVRSEIDSALGNMPV